MPHLIVFVGPDGCGKTTIARLVSAHLTTSSYGRLSIVQRSFSFGVLPPLQRLAGLQVRGPAPPGTRNAGMVAPLGYLRCLVLTGWYGLDHVLGRFVISWSPNTIYIFTRNFLDFYYTRAYRRALRPLLTMFTALGPVPDLTIVLRRDPLEIHSSKPELTCGEIANQYALIRNRLSEMPGYVEIDAGNGIERTVAAILRLIGL